MELGERIRALRQERGLTQTQLAGDCITRNMLSQIENGSAKPSMKTLEHLAAALGVSVGSLMGSEKPASYPETKELLRQNRMQEALEATEREHAGDDEGFLLLSVICAALAEESLCKGELSRGEELAARAISCNAQTLYYSGERESLMLWVQARCMLGRGKSAAGEVKLFRRHYDAGGWEAKNHLLMAREHLVQHNWQAAEREIWTITALPDRHRSEYLYVRGRLCVAQEKYRNALSFLRQAEEQAGEDVLLLREIWEYLELCCKELEDYKGAYEYAAKRREK